MNPMKTRIIDHALKSKGFKSTEKRDHIWYFLYVKGIKTKIRTKISHGEKEYGNELLSRMHRQLKLTKKEFEKFIGCPISEDDYVSMLVEKKYIQLA